MLPLLAMAAQAASLDSPVATDAHGRVRVALVVAGEERLREAAKFPDKGLRLDAIPVDGVGVWVGAGWRSAAAPNDHRDLGWSVGLGGRAMGWLNQGLAVGVMAGTASGGRWTTGEQVQRERRFAEIAGAPTLVVGARDGGAYLWAGPGLSLSAEAPTSDAAIDWGAASGALGVELGGELHSADLLGPGDPRRAYVSAGAAVHAVDSFRLSVWTGLAW